MGKAPAKLHTQASIESCNLGTSLARQEVESGESSEALRSAREPTHVQTKIYYKNIQVLAA